MATLVKVNKSHTAFLIYPGFRPLAVVMRCAANVACALEVADANGHAQHLPQRDTHMNLMHCPITAQLPSRQAMLYKHIRALSLQSPVT